MAYVTDLRAAQNTGASVLNQILSLRSDLAARYAQYRTYRTTLNELRGLSARELDDLGLAFADLKTISREAAAK